jgi:RNA recognition motif-containing protein
MSCLVNVKLYVEGFPSTLTDDELAKLFSQFGIVVSAVIARTIADESRCLGNVEMITIEEADKAIKALHRTRIDEKLIQVFHDVWPDPYTGVSFR